MNTAARQGGPSARAIGGVWDAAADAPGDSAARALEHAEMSRNLAESARAAAIQERKEAMMKFMEEQQARQVAEGLARELQAEKDQLMRALRAESQEKSRTQESLADLQAQLAVLQDNVDLLQAARMESDRTKIKLTEQLDRESARNVMLEEKIASKHAFNDQLKTELKMTIQTRTQHENRANKLQQELDRCKADFKRQVDHTQASYERECKQQKARAMKAELALKDTATELARQADMTAKLNVERREYMRRHESDKLDKQGLQQEVMELRRKVEHLEAANAQLSAANMQLAALKDHERESREASEQRTRQLESENYVLKEALRQQSAECEHYRRRYRPERENNKRLQQALWEAESSLREAKASWRCEEQQKYDALVAHQEAVKHNIQLHEEVSRERAGRLLAERAISAAAAGGLEDVEGVYLLMNEEPTSVQDAVVEQQQSVERLKKAVDDMQSRLDAIAGAAEQQQRPPAARTRSSMSDRGPDRQGDWLAPHAPTSSPTPAPATAIAEAHALQNAHAARAAPGSAPAVAASVPQRPGGEPHLVQGTRLEAMKRPTAAAGPPAPSRSHKVPGPGSPVRLAQPNAPAAAEQLLAARWSTAVPDRTLPEGQDWAAANGHSTVPEGAPVMYGQGLPSDAGTASHLVALPSRQYVQQPTWQAVPTQSASQSSPPVLQASRTPTCPGPPDPKASGRTDMTDMSGLLSDSRDDSIARSEENDQVAALPNGHGPYKQGEWLTAQGPPSPPNKDGKGVHLSEEHDTLSPQGTSSSDNLPLVAAASVDGHPRPSALMSVDSFWEHIDEAKGKSSQLGNGTNTTVL